jgi:hypothetical protein
MSHSDDSRPLDRDIVNLRSLKRFCDGPSQYGLNVPAGGYAPAGYEGSSERLLSSARTDGEPDEPVD